MGEVSWMLWFPWISSLASVWKDIPTETVPSTPSCTASTPPTPSSGEPSDTRVTLTVSEVWLTLDCSTPTPTQFCTRKAQTSPGDSTCATSATSQTHSST